MREFIHVMIFITKRLAILIIGLIVATTLYVAARQQISLYQSMELNRSNTIITLVMCTLLALGCLCAIFITSIGVISPTSLAGAYKKLIKTDE